VLLLIVDRVFYSLSHLFLSFFLAFSLFLCVFSLCLLCFFPRYFLGISSCAPELSAGVEPALESDGPEMDHRWSRRMGLVHKVAVTASDKFVLGQTVVVRHAGSPYDYCRGEIMTKHIRPTDHSVKVFLEPYSRMEKIRIEHLAVEKGVEDRLRRQKVRSRDVVRLEERTWYD
jgi:hypothetical protein